MHMVAQFIPQLFLSLFHHQLATTQNCQQGIKKEYFDAQMCLYSQVHAESLDLQAKSSLTFTPNATL